MLVNQSHRPGEGVFPVGRTRVYYNATDKYGNRASCVLNVTVKGGRGSIDAIDAIIIRENQVFFLFFLSDVCENLTAPRNGRLNCSASTTDEDRETRCVVTCEDGYDFEPTTANFNDAINDDHELLLKCNTGNRTWLDNKLPECLGTFAFAETGNARVYFFVSDSRIAR